MILFPEEKTEPKPLYITFGKEYELGEFISYFRGRRKHYDGSGPPETTTGPFKSIRKAIYSEYLLIKTYGELVVHKYYIKSNGQEEKGNHFHFRLNGDDHAFFNLYKHSTHFVKPELNRLLTLNQKWRNSFDKWNGKPIPEVNFYRFTHYRRREYSFITPNTKAKRTLTIEIRASEGSIIGDLCWLSIVLGTFNPEQKYSYNTNISKEIEHTNISLKHYLINNNIFLDFSYLEKPQQTEFEEFTRFLKYKDVHDIFNAAQKWTLNTLSDKEKKKIQRRVLSTLIS